MVVRMATSMSAMTVMHEEVHHRAGQQQQKWQRTEDVGSVLS